MALAQIYSAIAGDTITAARWNNEFGNIYSNGTDVAFPATKSVSFAGFTLTIDASGVSTITSPSNTGFLFTVGSKSGAPSASGSLASFTASTFTDSSTAISGTAALWAGVSIRTPTLAASATGVITTVAASLYVEGAPTAGANETITQGYGIYSAGVIGSTKPYIDVKGTDIASAATIAVTVPFADVTGTTTISAISTVYNAGATFRLRFTGAGLNITYNATSMITPWAVDYRTVPNELIEFVSLGSGNYMLYSLNGPKERTGTTIEYGSSTVPAGFLGEDAASLLRATYTGLFAVIGTTYGSVDGTHFTAPDRKGRMAIGVDAASSRVSAASTNGGNAVAIGGVGGNENLPSHQHTETYAGSGVGDNSMVAHELNKNVAADSNSVTKLFGTVGVTGVMNPWIAKNFCIRF